MRVLGIDPGTYNMGVGVVADAGDSNFTFVHADVLTAKRSLKQPERLHCLYAALLKYISKFEPSEIAIEEPFVARNVRSAMAVGQAQAVAMIAAAASGISVHSYAPREVKLAVTGFGGSSKEQVQDMVMLTLNVDTPSMSFDASDALAIAICHFNAVKTKTLTMKGWV